MTGEPNIWWSRAALVLLVVTAVVLLAAPAFPSEDGPVHLYYVDILHGLLTHSGPYSSYFQIKTLLTPYSLEYYTLLGLETVFPALVSEKLLIFGYILLFGAGFKRLVEAVAGRNTAWSLAGIPFAMNVLLYLGFLNYCLGVALALLLCGMWIAWSADWTRRRVAALLGGFAAMLLAHPIPVAIFLMFAGLHLAVDFAVTVRWSGWRKGILQRRLPLGLLALMAVVSLGWIRLFVEPADQGPPLPGYAAQIGFFKTAELAMLLRPVSPLNSLVYSGMLLLVAGVAASVLVTHPWKAEGRWRPAPVALMAAGGICFLLFCFVPPQINGTWYFAERFPIFSVLFLIAAAAALRPSPRWNAIAGVVAAGVTLGVVAMQWSAVAAIAGQLRPVLEAPAAKPGSTGLIVGTPKAYPDGLGFDPYMWAGVHYFRRSQAFLANAPWMEQTHILLRPVSPNRWSYTDRDDAATRMLGVTAGGEGVPELDFLIQEGPEDQGLRRLANIAGFQSFAADSEFLRLYRRQP